MPMKIKKVQIKQFDVELILDAACYAFNTNRAILMSPADTLEKQILIYCLYKYTKLSFVSIGLTLGMSWFQIRARAEDIQEKIHIKRAKYDYKIHGMVTDVHEYAKMTAPRKQSARDIVRSIRKEWVESHGVDILEFVRWPHKKQVEWINEHRVDVAQLKKDGVIPHTKSKYEIANKVNGLEPPTNIC